MEAGLVTRVANRVKPPDPRMALLLLVGPRDGGSTIYTDEELALGWETFGAGQMEQCVGRGYRPWGYWHFVLKEERPDNEQLRLAELGLLTDAEIEEVRKAGEYARQRLASGENLYSGESGCRESLAVWERVQAALAARK